MSKYGATSILLMLFMILSLFSQDSKMELPPEVSVLKIYPGTWDATFTVWPHGPDSSRVTFSGVETIHAFGDYWLASDLVSEYNGQVVRVHSVVGYDLNKNQLTGLIIDEGPYAATMTGTYDADHSTIHWVIKGQFPDGKPLLQKTREVMTGDSVRQVILYVPGKTEDTFVKMMEIEYIKRK